MNKIGNQYIKNAKAFFPVIGKAERRFFKNLVLNIEDYCEENVVTTIEELNESFGSPSELVHTYYATVNTETILKQIKLSRTIKIVCAIFITIALTVASLYSGIIYSEHQMIKEQQMFMEEITIWSHFIN